ncbi:MAG: ABC transporter permease [Planctomycetaceae bacterium]
MTRESAYRRFQRRFLRHKLAVASLFVILVYFAVAVLLLIGWPVNEEAATARFGPMHVPGFYITPPAEDRLMKAEWWIQYIDSALKKPDPQKAIQDLQRVGYRRPAELSVAEFTQRTERSFAVLDALDRKLGDEQFSDESLTAEIQALESEVDRLYEPLESLDAFRQSAALLLGTDRQGRSIFFRAVYAIQIAVMVGAVTGLASVAIGTVLGMAAGLWGGWVDGLVTWLYTTLASIPNLVLLILLAHVFSGTAIDDRLNRWTSERFSDWMGGRLIGDTLFPVYVAFIATFWIGPCRVIRGETLKIRELEYVQAATVMGFGRLRILFRHVLPNVAYLMLINFSLLFIGAIKSEVILSFLGLGVKNVPSWGTMISNSGYEVINGFFWQIGAATVFMLVLVLAFNIVSDALQDVFDPRHV